MKRTIKFHHLQGSSSKIKLFSPRNCEERKSATRSRRHFKKHTRSEVNLSNKKSILHTKLLSNPPNNIGKHPKLTVRVLQKPLAIVPIQAKHRRLLSDQLNVEPETLQKKEPKRSLKSNSTKKIFTNPSMTQPQFFKVPLNSPDTSFVDEEGELPVHLSFPLIPTEVLEYHQFLLTSFEEEEILEYSEVYFLGDVIKKTVPGPFSYDNFGYDTQKSEYKIVVGDHIAYRYEIVSKLGKGSFGEVVKAFDHKLNKWLALKIIRNKYKFYKHSLNEIRILKLLAEKDMAGKGHIVKIQENFVFRNHMCISFELLSINLYEYLKLNHFRGAKEFLVKKIAVQILEGLCLLSNQSIIHCDLKPENILLENPSSSKLKIVDFGSSCLESEKVYTYIQSRYYRAPEVILGISYSIAIDMWSLGCILSELFTGQPLFGGSSEAAQIELFVELLGKPPSALVAKGKRANFFFDSNGQPRLSKNKKWEYKTLDVVLAGASFQFKKFVKSCLEWDPGMRITPNEALRHEWIYSEKEERLKARHRRCSTDINEVNEAAIIYKQEIIQNLKKYLPIK